MRVAVGIELSDDERATLVKWSKGRSAPARVVLRAKIVLAAAEGMQNKDIAALLGVTRKTVGEWRLRFVEARCAGLEKDAPRGGRPATRRDEVARKIVEATTQTKPPAGTHWSTRTLAKQLGVSRAMVHRVWQANQLKPHLTKTFKLSNDPRFVEKSWSTWWACT